MNHRLGPGRSGNHAQGLEARIKRLAAGIDSLADKDEQYLREAREIDALRRSAAAQLHAVCAAFVAEINRLVTKAEVSLTPAEYSADSFRDDAPNLLQINVRGRILQVEFEATPGLTSTEDFRIPYTMAGAVRAFNQELLEKSHIEEQLIFYTIEKQGNLWRYFDSRTYRSGPFDREYLVSLMERLV